MGKFKDQDVENQERDPYLDGITNREMTDMEEHDVNVAKTVRYDIVTEWIRVHVDLEGDMEKNQQQISAHEALRSMIIEQEAQSMLTDWRLRDVIDLFYNGYEGDTFETASSMEDWFDLFTIDGEHDWMEDIVYFLEKHFSDRLIENDPILRSLDESMTDSESE